MLLYLVVSIIPFDTYYAEQSNVRWGNPGDWWPGQGRNFRLGVEVTI